MKGAFRESKTVIAYDDGVFEAECDQLIRQGWQAVSYAEEPPVRPADYAGAVRYSQRFERWAGHPGVPTRVALRPGSQATVLADAPLEVTK